MDDTVHLQTIKGKHIFPHPWKHRFMYLGSKRMSTACPSNCGFRQSEVVEKSQDFNFELRIKKFFIYFIFYVCFFYSNVPTEMLDSVQVLLVLRFKNSII